MIVSIISNDGLEEEPSIESDDQIMMTSTVTYHFILETRNSIAH